MNERTCIYLNCNNEIGELPEDYFLCTDHQIEVRTFEHIIRHWIENRTLPLHLIAWALSRENYGCSTNELASLLEMTIEDLKGKLPGKKIHFKTKKGSKIVPIQEIIRILDFFINASEIKAQVRKSGYKKSGVSNRATNKKGQYNTADVAKMFDVVLSSVHMWIRKKILKPFRTNTKGLVFNEKSINSFLENACSGKEIFKAKTLSIIKNRVMTDKSFGSLREKARQNISEIIGEDTLPEEDLEFAVFHSQGCNDNHFTEHVAGFYAGDIHVAAAKNIITLTKVNGKWFIPFTQMIKALSLLRNWMPLSEVKLDLVSFDTFYTYVKEGYFGETTLNLSGHLSIKRNVLPQMEDICLKVRSKKGKIRAAAYYLSRHKPTRT